MLITGHISSFVPSPLVGPNIEELGTRFPDMSEVYKKDLQEIIRNTAKNCGIPLKEGVYVQTTGPNYETPEEIRNACLRYFLYFQSGGRYFRKSADTCGDPGDGRPGGTAVSAADHGIHSEYCKPVE